MRFVLFVLLVALPTLVSADPGHDEAAMNAKIDADQEACFGAVEEDACVNNAQAHCIWKTVMEGEHPVSWCEMKLPWQEK